MQHANAHRFHKHAPRKQDKDISHIKYTWRAHNYRNVCNRHYETTSLITITLVVTPLVMRASQLAKATANINAVIQNIIYKAAKAANKESNQNIKRIF